MKKYNILVAYSAVPAHAWHYETVETGRTNSTGEELRELIVLGSDAAKYTGAFSEIESGLKQIGNLC